MVTARLLAARHAVMLVHSFSGARTGFPDYAAFLELFDLTAKEGTVQSAVMVGGIELYFSWTVGASALTGRP